MPFEYRLFDLEYVFDDAGCPGEEILRPGLEQGAGTLIQLGAGAGEAARLEPGQRPQGEKGGLPQFSKLRLPAAVQQQVGAAVVHGAGPGALRSAASRSSSGSRKSRLPKIGLVSL